MVSLSGHSFYSLFDYFRFCLFFSLRDIPKTTSWFAAASLMSGQASFNFGQEKFACDLSVLCDHSADDALSSSSASISIASVKSGEKKEKSKAKTTGSKDSARDSMIARVREIVDAPRRHVVLALEETGWSDSAEAINWLMDNLDSLSPGEEEDEEEKPVPSPDDQTLFTSEEKKETINESFETSKESDEGAPELKYSENASAAIILGDEYSFRCASPPTPPFSMLLKKNDSEGTEFAKATVEIRRILENNVSADEIDRVFQVLLQQIRDGQIPQATAILRSYGIPSEFLQLIASLVPSTRTPPNPSFFRHSEIQIGKFAAAKFENSRDVPSTSDSHFQLGEIVAIDFQNELCLLRFYFSEKGTILLRWYHLTSLFRPLSIFTSSPSQLYPLSATSLSLLENSVSISRSYTSLMGKLVIWQLFSLAPPPSHLASACGPSSSPSIPIHLNYLERIRCRIQYYLSWSRDVNEEDTSCVFSKPIERLLAPNSFSILATENVLENEISLNSEICCQYHMLFNLLRNSLDVTVRKIASSTQVLTDRKFANCQWNDVASSPTDTLGFTAYFLRSPPISLQDSALVFVHVNPLGIAEEIARISTPRSPDATAQRQGPEKLLRKCELVDLRPLTIWCPHFRVGLLGSNENVAFSVTFVPIPTEEVESFLILDELMSLLKSKKSWESAECEFRDTCCRKTVIFQYLLDKIYLLSFPCETKIRLIRYLGVLLVLDSSLLPTATLSRLEKLRDEMEILAETESSKGKGRERLRDKERDGAIYSRYYKSLLELFTAVKWSSECFHSQRNSSAIHSSTSSTSSPSTSISLHFPATSSSTSSSSSSASSPFSASSSASASSFSSSQATFSFSTPFTSSTLSAIPSLPSSSSNFSVLFSSHSFGNPTPLPGNQDWDSDIRRVMEGFSGPLLPVEDYASLVNIPSSPEDTPLLPMISLSSASIFSDANSSSLPLSFPHTSSSSNSSSSTVRMTSSPFLSSHPSKNSSSIPLAVGVLETLRFLLQSDSNCDRPPSSSAVVSSSSTPISSQPEENFKEMKAIFSSAIQEIAAVNPLENVVVLSPLPSFPIAEADYVVKSVKRFLKENDCGRLHWITLPPLKRAVSIYPSGEHIIPPTQSSSSASTSVTSGSFTSPFIFFTLSNPTTALEVSQSLNGKSFKDEMLFSPKAVTSSNEKHVPKKVKVTARLLSSYRKTDEPYEYFCRAMLLGEDGHLLPNPRCAFTSIYGGAHATVPLETVAASAIPSASTSKKRKREMKMSNSKKEKKKTQQLPEGKSLLSHAKRQEVSPTLVSPTDSQSLEEFLDQITLKCHEDPVAILDRLVQFGYDCHVIQHRYLNERDAILSQRMSLWTNLDDLFIQYIEEIAGESGLDALHLPVHRIGPIGKESELSQIPVPALRLRFAFFKSLNEKMSNLLPLIDLSMFSRSSRHTLKVGTNEFIFSSFSEVR